MTFKRSTQVWMRGCCKCVPWVLGVFRQILQVENTVQVGFRLEKSKHPHAGHSVLNMDVQLRFWTKRVHQMLPTLGRGIFLESIPAAPLCFGSLVPCRSAKASGCASSCAVAKDLSVSRVSSQDPL